MEAGKVGKFKQYVVTVIPAANVVKARTPLKFRLTKEELAAGATLPQSPHRVTGQQVKVVDNLEAAWAWVDKVATEDDQVTIHRWKPGHRRKKR